MARPKGKNVRPVNLTIRPGLKNAAARIAFKNNISLSQLVTELLEARILQEESLKIGKAA